MFWIMASATDIIAVFLAVAPFVFLWQKFAPSQRKKTFWHKACIWAFVFYLSAVFAITGLPTLAESNGFDATVTLHLFEKFFEDFVQYALNVVLFIPLGVFLPLLWKRYASLSRVTLFSFGLSLFIETAQLFCFRITDINDLLMNTLGGMIGFGCWYVLRKLWSRAGEISLAGEGQGVVMTAMVVVASYLGKGFISDTIFKMIYR